MKIPATIWPVPAVTILVSCNGKGWKQDTGGVTVKVAEKTVDGPSRETATPGKKFSGRKSLIIVPQESKPVFSVSEAGGSVLMETSSVKACRPDRPVCLCRKGSYSGSLAIRICIC